MGYTRRKGKLAALKRKYRRRRTTGLSKNAVKSVKAIAKSVSHAMCEKKTFIWMDENKALLHNKGDYTINFLSCKQGVEDNEDGTTGSQSLNRIGDEFLLKNVNIRLWLFNKQDRPNVMYKCYLFWNDPDATLSDAYCFFSQQNKMLDRPNSEVISIVDQKTIFSGPSYSGTEHERSQLCTLNGSWKGKKITYDQGGSVPKFKTLGMCVVCYDAYGTLQTDNIASYVYNCAVRYIDPQLYIFYIKKSLDIKLSSP